MAEPLACVTTNVWRCQCGLLVKAARKSCRQCGTNRSGVYVLACVKRIRGEVSDG